jgi:hypothetical protein
LAAGINQKKGMQMHSYSDGGNDAATPLPLPTQQLRLPLPAAMIPIAVAELENMIRAAGVERTLEAAVAVERT